MSKNRKKLHAEIALAIEGLHVDDLQEYYGFLADHYIEAEDFLKGAEYSKKAGRMFENRGSLNDAVKYAGPDAVWVANTAGVRHGSRVGPEHAPRPYSGSGRGASGPVFLSETLRCHVAPVCPGASGRILVRDGPYRHVRHGNHVDSEVTGTVSVLNFVQPGSAFPGAIQLSCQHRTLLRESP